ncbi:hypothetical protein [Micromonospora arida]|uniref:hypothetical protein n=1 Tax=Micromonospora arida TaxID=2203715 RepID=UPI003F4C2C72
MSTVGTVDRARATTALPLRGTAGNRGAPLRKATTAVDVLRNAVAWLTARGATIERGAVGQRLG